MLTGYLRIVLILCCKHIDIVHIIYKEKGSDIEKGIVIKLAKLFPHTSCCTNARRTNYGLA